MRALLVAGMRRLEVRDELARAREPVAVLRQAMVRRELARRGCGRGRRRDAVDGDVQVMEGDAAAVERQEAERIGRTNALRS